MDSPSKTANFSSLCRNRCGHLALSVGMPRFVEYRQACVRRSCLAFRIQSNGTSCLATINAVSQYSVLPHGCGPIYPQAASARNPSCIFPVAKDTVVSGRTFVGTKKQDYPQFEALSQTPLPSTSFVF
jgi:hypothetical protein